MIWFFIILSTCTLATLLKIVHDTKKERRVQTATLDSLLAVIGGEKNSLNSSKLYFKYLRKSLDDDDFARVIQNVTFASDLDFVRDDKGNISSPTIDQLVPIFNNYAISIHQRMQE